MPPVARPPGALDWITYRSFVSGTVHRDVGFREGPDFLRPYGSVTTEAFFGQRVFDPFAAFDQRQDLAIRSRSSDRVFGPAQELTGDGDRAYATCRRIPDDFKRFPRAGKLEAAYVIRANAFIDPEHVIAAVCVHRGGSVGGAIFNRFAAFVFGIRCKCGRSGR